MKMNFLVSLTLVVPMLSACGGSNSGQLVGAEFSSLSQCLTSIKAKTGMELRPMTDSPDKVSGYLGNTNRDFACEKKSTGTKGTYFEGWYELPPK